MSDDVSSRLRLVVPAVGEPVTLSEAKLFLRIEHAAEDAVITRAIVAAREACELAVGSALLPQSWSYSLVACSKARVALPVGPATAINMVTVDGVEIATTAYRLSVDGFSLFFDATAVGTIEITFVASLANNAAALPALLKQGILHHVAAMLEQREGIAAMPMASLACYQPFRRVRL